MKTVVAIPCWNPITETNYALEETVLTLQGQSDVVLIDNHSPFPETREFVNKLGQSESGIHVLRPQRPLSVAGCMNAAFSYAKQRGGYDFFIKIDDDVRIHTITLSKLQGYLDSCPEIGIVSPYYSPDSDTAIFVNSDAYEDTLGHNGIMRIEGEIAGSFMMMRMQDMDSIAQVHGTPFVSDSMYGHEDHFIRQQLREFGFHAIYDTDQLIEHKSIRIKALKLYKQQAMGGETRLSLGDWLRLYGYTEASILTRFRLKMSEIVGTRFHEG